MPEHVKYFSADGLEVFDEPSKDAVDYIGHHRLEQVTVMTNEVEAMVFYNVARKGFQRAKGAEMIT